MRTDTPSACVCDKSSHNTKECAHRCLPFDSPLSLTVMQQPVPHLASLLNNHAKGPFSSSSSSAAAPVPSLSTHTSHSLLCSHTHTLHACIPTHATHTHTDTFTLDHPLTPHTHTPHVSLIPILVCSLLLSSLHNPIVHSHSAPSHKCVLILHPFTHTQ